MKVFVKLMIIQTNIKTRNEVFILEEVGDLPTLELTKSNELNQKLDELVKLTINADRHWLITYGPILVSGQTDSEDLASTDSISFLYHAFIPEKITLKDPAQSWTKLENLNDNLKRIYVECNSKGRI